MTWGFTSPFLQLDDRVAVDPHEVAVVASHGSGSSVWMRGADGNQGIYVARPFPEILRALEDARRPRYADVVPTPSAPAPAPVEGGGADLVTEQPTS